MDFRPITFQGALSVFGLTEQREGAGLVERQPA